MLMRGILIYSLLCATLLGGCGEATTENQAVMPDKDTVADSVMLVEDETIYFPIDSATNYNTLYLTTYHDSLSGRRYLVYQADGKNSIQFYDFDSRKLVKEIVFSKFGPHGIPRVTGFYVFNPDLLLVLSGHARKLYLADGRARVLQTYSLLKGDESAATSMALFTTGNEPFIVGDTLYLHALPDRSPYYRGYHIQRIDLRTGHHEYMGRFPDIYEKLGGWHNMFTHVYKYYDKSAGRLISSHSGSRYLYAGPLANTLRERYYAGSRYFDDAAPIKQDFDNTNYHYLTQNLYRQILYDPYRQVYYRLARLAIEPFNEHGAYRKIEDQPLTIIILNKELQKIGETLLPEGKYFYRTLFVEKEGLYIAATNYKNPQLREDRLAFTLLKLQPKE